MRISCYRCGGSGWICEPHPDKPDGHDHCEGPGIPCPVCNSATATSGNISLPLAAWLSDRRPAPRDSSSGRFIGRHQIAAARAAQALQDGGATFTLDRFDYATLWLLLEHIQQTHRLLRFNDVTSEIPADRFCLLRHDVDYSLESALRLAKDEAARGIHATYFLLTNGEYYNLLSPVHAHVPRMLTTLGHEVGLHYDAALFDGFEPEEWDSLLDLQVQLLERLSGSSVTSIAMHQPGLTIRDPFRSNPRYVNVYAERFCRDVVYLSDSCRAWKNAAVHTLVLGPLPAHLQLGLHPINWADDDRSRELIFRGLHIDFASAVLAAGEKLMTRMAEHPGVQEHDARAAVERM